MTRRPAKARGRTPRVVSKFPKEHDDRARLGSICIARNRLCRFPLNDIVRGVKRCQRGTATSLASHDLPIEMRMTYHALEQSHPEGHHHFRATRSGDVANVDNVIRLPAEPIAEMSGDFPFRGSVVAANEQVVIARNTGGVDHIMSQFTVLSAL